MPDSLRPGTELHPPAGPFTDDLLTMTRDGKQVEFSSRAAWQEKRADIRRRVSGILGESPKRRVPLDPEVLGEETLHGSGVIRRKVSYSVERGERVSAYLLMPPGMNEASPAVLCLHQTIASGKEEPVGLSGSPDLAYALHLVLRGFVTLSPDHITAGERIGHGLQPFDTAAFYERHPSWSAVGKAIWDNRCAVDYLNSLDFVDPKRIGCIGHSLGGHSTAFSAAFDERIRAAVCNCGMTLFAEDPNRLEWARDHWYIYLPRLRPCFLENRPAPFDLHEVVALIAPRPFLNISALNDACFPRTNALAEMGVRVNKVYRLLEKEEVFANYLHGNGHSFLPEARALAYTWLARWLKNEALPRPLPQEG